MPNIIPSTLKGHKSRIYPFSHISSSRHIVLKAMNSRYRQLGKYKKSTEFKTAESGQTTDTWLYEVLTRQRFVHVVKNNLHANRIYTCWKFNSVIDLNLFVIQFQSEFKPVIYVVSFKTIYLTVTFLFY